MFLSLAAPCRSGRRVDYRFYNQLEQILGQEAVSMDDYDEREEQADPEPGTVVFIRFLCSVRNVPLDKHPATDPTSSLCLHLM